MAADDTLPAPFTLHAPAVVGGALPLPAGTLTRARTDDELIAVWLARPNLSPRTVRNSRKEAQRFLFWIRAHGKTLTDVRYEDLIAYAAFLADPQPAAEWICATRHRRTDPRWRPFCGPLAEPSQMLAMTVLKGLFRWAHAAEYLPSNPAQLLGSFRLSTDSTVTRFVPALGISFLLLAADQLTIDTPTAQLRRARARFLVQAYYLTAVRLHELGDAGMRSIRPDQKGSWWVHVVGKGRKMGKVPAPPALLAEFRAYRQAFGLPPLPAPDETTPLVLATRGQLRRASHSAIARSIKTVAGRAAVLAAEAGQHEIAHQLKRMSTHWLRHSSLTHQVDAGVPLKAVQLNGRHASIKTTGGYLHRPDEKRHAETSAAIRIEPLSQ